MAPADRGAGDGQAPSLPGTPPAHRKGRLIQLDFLRGIAVLLVLGHHTVMDPAAAGPLAGFASFLRIFGWTGVDLFFVLSGFLVGGLLLKEIKQSGSLDIGRFLVRRGFRIWPSYFVYLVVMTPLVFHGIAKPLAGQEGALGRGLWLTAAAMLPNWAHLQNYLGSPLVHTWTLAIEEHFYLALPLLLALLLRMKGGRVHVLPVLSIIIAAACTGLRLASFSRPYDDIYYHATHYRMDSLLFGVLLAYFYHFRPDRLDGLMRYRVPLLALGLALVAPMSVLDAHSPWVRTLGYTSLYLGYGMLLLVVVHSVPGEGAIGRLLASRAGRTVAAVGFYSYPIYLWHIPLVRLGFTRVAGLVPVRSLPMGIGWVIVELAYVLVAVGVGVAAAKAIERPALALRDRLFPAKADAIRA